MAHNDFTRHEHMLACMKFEQAVKSRPGMQTTTSEGDELPEWHDLSKMPIYLCKKVLDVPRAESLQPLRDAYARLFKARSSPLTYFAQLVDDAQQLLTCLTLTRSFLTGSYALHYFILGMADEHSTWDFYCIGSDAQFHLLIWCMDYFGFKPELLLHGQPDTANVTEIVVGTINANKVRLVWDRESTTPIRCVTWLHSTILSCYISGVNAVCTAPHLAVHKISGKRYQGKLGYEHLAEFCADEYRAYENKGVEYVSADLYFDGLRAGNKPDNGIDLQLPLIMPIHGALTDFGWTKANTVPNEPHLSRSSANLLEVVFERGSWSEDTRALRIERWKMLRDLCDAGVEHVSRSIGWDASSDLCVESYMQNPPKSHECASLPVPEFMISHMRKGFVIKLDSTRRQDPNNRSPLAAFQCDVESKTTETLQRKRTPCGQCDDETPIEPDYVFDDTDRDCFCSALLPTSKALRKGAGGSMMS